MNKKVCLLFFIVAICFTVVKLISMVSVNENKNFDMAPVASSVALFSQASDEMPKMSGPAYETEEYRLLNDIVNEGNIIYQYKNVFENKKRLDYDIEARYADFNTDFRKYYVHIGEHIKTLKSLNPTYVKEQQKETVEAVLRFYKKIGEYEKHNSQLKDTIAYLEECHYELQRIRNLAGNNFDSFHK